MESPTKRRRISSGNQAQNPITLPRRETTRNDLQFKLRSTFESIFEKYGRDFGGIGDEVDLTTGRIVVDNGHLLGMKHETDLDTTAKASDPTASTQHSDKNKDELGQYIYRKLGPGTDTIPNGNGEEGDSLGIGGLEESRDRNHQQSQKRISTYPSSQIQHHISAPALDAAARKFIRDPLWEFPELPGDSMNLNPEEEDEEPSDETFQREASPETSLWAIDDAERQDAHKRKAWTKSEDGLLAHLRTQMPQMGYKEMVLYFPGRTTNTLYSRWALLQRKSGATPRSDEDAIGPPKRRSWSHIEDKAERLRAINKASVDRYRARKRALKGSLSTSNGERSQSQNYPACSSPLAGRSKGSQADSNGSSPKTQPNTPSCLLTPRTPSLTQASLPPPHTMSINKKGHGQSVVVTLPSSSPSLDGSMSALNASRVSARKMSSIVFPQDEQEDELSIIPRQSPEPEQVALHVARPKSIDSEYTEIDPGNHFVEEPQYTPLYDDLIQTLAKDPDKHSVSAEDESLHPLPDMSPVSISPGPREPIFMLCDETRRTPSQSSNATFAEHITSSMQTISPEPCQSTSESSPIAENLGTPSQSSDFNSDERRATPRHTVSPKAPHFVGRSSPLPNEPELSSCSSDPSITKQIATPKRTISPRPPQPGSGSNPRQKKARTPSSWKHANRPQESPKLLRTPLSSLVDDESEDELSAIIMNNPTSRFRKLTLSTTPNVRSSACAKNGTRCGRTFCTTCVSRTT